MTRRLYVTHPRGWRLPHHGGFRAYGEFFEDLPEDVHNELADTQPEVFSKTAPKVEAKTSTSVAVETPDELFDDGGKG